MENKKDICMDDLPDFSDGSNTDYETEDEVEEEIKNCKIRVSINTSTIISTYISYLQNNKLELSPEYQRDICWSIKKMNSLIDTIMKGLIVPNFVIYKLSSPEKKNSKHFYECIDGQHRLFTLKKFIDSEKVYDKYIYWKNNNERVFYNMSESQLQKIKRRYRKLIIRNFTEEEKDQFDGFQLSIHSIETENPSISMSYHVKCDIFNRLQNGERVSSWIKLRNMDNIIINTIRSNNLLKKLNDIKFINKIKSNKNLLKEPEAFNIYFLIRAFLIIDKKNLEINYLDINIKNYLEQNNFKGAPSVQINRDINEIVLNVIEVIEFISKKYEDKCILTELAYIYLCIYSNFGLDKLSKLIKYFDNNISVFNKYNDIFTYKNNARNATSSKKMIEIYTEICNIKTNIKKEKTVDL